MIAGGPVSAAGITDVQSSFDEGDPFDFSLKINYEYGTKSVRLTRESIDGQDVRLANKLKFEETTHLVRFDVAMGLYKDLELAVDLPLVVSEQVSLGMHPEIPTGGNPYSYISDIDTAAGPTPGALFDVPFTGPDRKGLGDIGVGLRWAPWHYKRDHQYPSWLIGAMFRIPSASIKKADNTAVGEGVFAAEINTAISRRVTPFFEPYFDLHGILKVSTSKSLFDEVPGAGDAQTLVKPGNQMGLKLGAEFIPWEVEAEERHVAIDMGVGLDYVFEGREYTELFDALGSSACRTSDGCWGTTYTRTPKGLQDFKGDTAAEDDAMADYKSQRDNDLFPRTDGITDVEHYGMYSFWFGLDAQPIKYLALGARFQLAYVQPHFITFADAGSDSAADSDVIVTGYNSQKINEYNPKYVEDIDQVGHRFRTGQALQWTLLFTMGGMF
jgi:hypothetical protein